MKCPSEKHLFSCEECAIADILLETNCEVFCRPMGW